MYRIVSRFLALFYFYLPPRLSFSLLLKRATNTLSLSLSSGEAKSLKKKKRFEREESSKTKRPFFARDFNLRVSPFKSKTKVLRARTFANTLKNTQTTNTFRALDYWYARSVVLIFSALTFCAFAHGCAVYQKKSFLGEEISAPSIASSFLYRTCDARSHLALTKFPTFSRDEARRSRCF